MLMRIVFLRGRPFIRNDFFHRNQIVFCLPRGIVTFFKIDCGVWHEKFLAAAGVFYMNGLDFSLQQNMGDKAIGTVQEDCFADFWVAHVGDYSMEGVSKKDSLIVSFTLYKICKIL